MAGLKRIRPLAGMGAPLRARHELRTTFSRWLCKQGSPEYQLPLDWAVDPVALLELCVRYRVEYSGSNPLLEREWDESPQRVQAGDPSFQQLVAAGWLFFEGSRWAMLHPPIGILSHVVYPSERVKRFLLGLSQPRLVANEAEPPTALRELAQRIEDNDWLTGGLPVRIADREWVVARLWERLSPDMPVAEGDGGEDSAEHVFDYASASDATAVAAEDESPHLAFKAWHSWCIALGDFGRWDIGWSDGQMSRCREAAYRVLEEQTIWGDWDNDLESYLRFVSVVSAGLPEERRRFAAFRPRSAPRTLVAKIDWLDDPTVDHLSRERQGASTASFAFYVLCSELEKTGIGPRTSEAAARFLAFVAGRPLATDRLRTRVSAAPALLVDMLLYAPTACLATRLVVDWRQQLGDDAALSAEREDGTKAFALEDALSMLVYQMTQGAADAEEIASLITWCYVAALRGEKPNAELRLTAGKRLLGAVGRQSVELQTAVLGHLVSQADRDEHVRMGLFSGVLDALTLLPAATNAISSPIVGLYIALARDFHLERTDVSTLSPEQAARLVSLALAQPVADRDALLTPVDVGARLRSTPEEEKGTVRTSLAFMLRDHVRLLARAVKAWPDHDIPTELAEALQRLTAIGSIEHAERGKVGALTERYNSMRIWLKERGSPAQDLAAAWSRLAPPQREALVRSLEGTDDPVLLAQLCAQLPSEGKVRLQEKLRHLSPDDASRPFTWTELERRVAALLEAGEAELARLYLDAGSVNIDGARSQQRLNNFGLRLQVLIKEQSWDAVDAMTVPSGLDQFIERQAQQQLRFYQATSQLLRPGGRIAEARASLQSLAAEPGASPVYKDNFYAAALRELLGETLGPLAGDRRRQAEELLLDMDAALSQSSGSMRSVSDGLLGNRAVLLLTLDRPGEAFESLAVRRSEKRDADLELFAAIARQKMGYPSEALSIINSALVDFGDDQRLIAARDELQAGSAPTALPAAALVVDHVVSAREAVLLLAQMQPSQVAEILGVPGGGLRGYLVREVSRAVGVLHGMAAMLRERENTDNEAKLENDLNTAVRALLNTAFAVQKWDVADQTLGGSTSAGNPGERDAVIRMSGQELSIYEALVVSGLNRTKLKSHFEKLFAYGAVDIYFHVTYSYAPSLQPTLDYIEQMAEREMPAGLSFMDCTQIGPPDYATSGLVARYRMDHREIAVAFLVVDLRLGLPPVPSPAPATSAPPAA